MRLLPSRLIEIAILGFGLLVPVLGIYPVFMMKLLCFGIFAAAFNLLLGFSGLLSFGHAAYFGLAAYVTAWLRVKTGLSTELALLAGVATSALAGLAIGSLAIRRQGIYFAMITLALAQCLYFFCLEASFTGGENGIQGVPRGAIFGLIGLQSDLAMYFFVLTMAVAVYLAIKRIVGSPFGQVLRAIGDNEQRAISLGYSVNRYKVLAFVLSAALAGLGGSLKSLVLGLATLSDVHQSTSGEVILMTLLGGTGTFLGPFVGAGLVVTLQEYLSDKVGSWVSVVIGAIFVICVLAFRAGIVGEAAKRFQRRRPVVVPE
jgi:branched-chain amino acid transport system permease protein